MTKRNNAPFKPGDIVYLNEWGFIYNLSGKYGILIERIPYIPIPYWNVFFPEAPPYGEWYLKEFGNSCLGDNLNKILYPLGEAILISEEYKTES